MQLIEIVNALSSILSLRPIVTVLIVRAGSYLEVCIYI